MTIATTLKPPNELTQPWHEREQPLQEESTELQERENVLTEKDQRIELLEEYINFLRYKQFESNSERDTGQAELFNEAEPLLSEEAAESKYETNQELDT
jgi:hypothetical protein